MVYENMFKRNVYAKFQYVDRTLHDMELHTHLTFLFYFIFSWDFRQERRFLLYSRFVGPGASFSNPEWSINSMNFLTGLFMGYGTELAVKICTDNGRCVKKTWIVNSLILPSLNLLHRLCTRYCTRFKPVQLLFSQYLVFQIRLMLLFCLIHVLAYLIHNEIIHQGYTGPRY